MFDTHCHLNFSRFKKNYHDVLERAKESGVDYFVVPGTELESSKRALKISEEYLDVYAAVGIHPHHVFELLRENDDTLLDRKIAEIEQLLSGEKVIAIGEVGLDKHIYENTKYQKYHANDTFIDLQKQFLRAQIALAQQYNKTVILHNREATADLLHILNKNWNDWHHINFVFHCCEPSPELLSFAVQHKVYIGVDGDITYQPEKQEFIKNIPLNLLVLETDSPFLLPEPLRSQKEYPNEPKNITVITEFVANILNKTKEEIAEVTSNNAKRLFQLK